MHLIHFVINISKNPCLQLTYESIKMKTDRRWIPSQQACSSAKRRQPKLFNR